MCGPCSDGTYWDGKGENEYSYKWVEPSEERCEWCEEPINWCHCGYRNGIYDNSDYKPIVRKAKK